DYIRNLNDLKTINVNQNINLNNINLIISIPLEKFQIKSTNKNKYTSLKKYEQVLNFKIIEHMLNYLTNNYSESLN
ncbi:MAG: hypothetical protein AB1782_03560, partial [Cyanobacteriota bacterium]